MCIYIYVYTYVYTHLTSQDTFVDCFTIVCLFALFVVLASLCLLVRLLNFASSSKFENKAEGNSNPSCVSFFFLANPRSRDV